MGATKRQIIIAYVPVLHEGYRRFFYKHPGALELLLIGEDIAKRYKPLEKDIRALPAAVIRDSLSAWKRFKDIEVIGPADWERLAATDALFIMPDEDAMRDLAEKHLPKSEVEFDSIFLRWDKHRSTEGKAVEADQRVASGEFERKMISLVRDEAKKSPDFWRGVGAAVIKGGKVLMLRHNHAVPDPMLPYSEGDPRSDFHKGVNVELSTAMHAEAGLIADAAREGISLSGAEMYVTTFPCPPCAKLIAYSGIKRVYYADGYGVLDGERVLKSRGVEIVFVREE